MFSAFSILILSFTRKQSSTADGSDPFLNLQATLINFVLL